MAIRVYRTKDGQDYFTFDVNRLPDNTLRAYIDDQPNYGSRSQDGESTHRFTETGTGRHYICYQPDSPLYTEKQIEGVMRWWAEETQHYIRTGIFRQPGS
jgi:hypothetical protein